MKLVILGNGFDLHHGLKTSFKDFKEWCEKNKDKEFIKKVDDIIKLNSKKGIQGDIELNWANIEEKLHHEYLKIELETIENKINAPEVHDFLLQEDYEELVDKRNELGRRIGESKSNYTLDEFEELTIEFTKKFDDYLKKEVLNETVNIKLNPKLQKDLNTASRVITFNYTDVHKRYNVEKEKLLCIHGNIRDGGYPVIGYYHEVKEVSKSDDYRKKYNDRLFSKEAVFDRMHGEELLPIIREFIYSTKDKNTSSVIPIKAISEIVFIGYSIGESDDFVTDFIFENSKKHNSNFAIKNLELDVLKVKIYNYNGCFENGEKRIKALLNNKYKIAKITGGGIDFLEQPNIVFEEESYE